jgi:mannosyltransferase
MANDQTRECGTGRTMIRRDRHAFLALLSLSLLFRSIAIGQESFFIDEVLTMKSCRGTWDHILNVEANPPLYFFLIRGWTAVFGLSHFSVRFFSALTGSLAPAFLFLAARAMRMSRTGALLAGAMLAISPAAVWYGQQARAYALVLSIICAWLYFLVRSVQERSRSASLAAAVLLFVGFSTHYYFAFVALAAVAVLTVFSLSGKDAPSFRSVVLPQGIAMALCLLYVPLVHIQLSRDTLAWTPRPHFADLMEVFSRIFTIGPFSDPPRIVRWDIGVFYGLVAVVLVLTTKRALAREERMWFVLLLAVAVLPVLLPYALSQGERSIFLKDRYTVVALPGFLLLVFQAVDRLRRLRNWGWGVAAALLIPMSLHSDVRYWATCQDFDWRGAISVTDKEWAAGDSIVFLPGWMWETYRNNGGTQSGVIAGDFRRALDEGKPRRVWLLVWEQDPDEGEKALASDLIRRAGSRIRIDFPHIKLWEIPMSPAP